MKMLLLRCPKCKNSMKYQSRDMILVKKRKQCVYCGKGFSITDHIVKKL